MSSLGTVNNVPIDSVAVAYNCPLTHSAYILLFHQVPHMKDLRHALINPNRLRHNGLMVNDVPLILLPPTRCTPDCHSIHSGTLLIPLKAKGMISYFDCRRPSMEEMNDSNHYPHIEMTASGEWDPGNPTISTDEKALRSAIESPLIQDYVPRSISNVESEWNQSVSSDGQLWIRYVEW
jgi:hypothetical protein